MTEVNPGRIASVPALATLLNPAFFRGIFGQGDRVVLVLDGDGLGSMSEVLNFYGGEPRDVTRHAKASTVAQASPKDRTAGQSSGAQVILFQVGGSPSRLISPWSNRSSSIESRPDAAPSPVRRGCAGASGPLSCPGEPAAAVRTDGGRTHASGGPVALRCRVGSARGIGGGSSAARSVAAGRGRPEPSPRVFGIRAEYIRGVANASGRPIVWLDIVKVLTATEGITLLA